MGTPGLWSEMKTFRTRMAPINLWTGDAFGTLESADTVSQTQFYTWDPVPGAISYELFIRSKETTQTVLHAKNLTNTSSSQTINLLLDKYQIWVLAVGQVAFEAVGLLHRPQRDSVVRSQSSSVKKNQRVPGRLAASGHPSFQQ